MFPVAGTYIQTLTTGHFTVMGYVGRVALEPGVYYQCDFLVIQVFLPLRVTAPPESMSS